MNLDAMCLIFAVITAVHLWNSIAHITGRIWPIVRTILGATAVTYAFDYIANDRGFWIFADLSDLKILKTPLQSTLMVLLLALNYAALYLRIRKRSGEHRPEGSKV